MKQKTKLGLIAGIGLLTAGVTTSFAGDRCRGYNSNASTSYKAHSHYKVKNSNHQYRSYTNAYTTYQNHYRNDRRRNAYNHNNLNLRLRTQAVNRRHNAGFNARAGFWVR